MALAALPAALGSASRAEDPALLEGQGGEAEAQSQAGHLAELGSKAFQNPKPFGGFLLVILDLFWIFFGVYLVAGNSVTGCSRVLTPRPEHQGLGAAELEKRLGRWVGFTTEMQISQEDVALFCPE